MAVGQHVPQRKAVILTRPEILDQDRDGAAQAHAATLEELSPQRYLVLMHLLSARSEKQIAKAMGLSPCTVHEYVHEVYKHFKVSGRIALMALWISKGLRKPTHRKSLLGRQLVSTNIKTCIPLNRGIDRPNNPVIVAGVHG